MTIFQVLAVLFALFMMYVVSIHRNKQSLSPAETSFWWSTWMLFIVIAMFPNTLLGISDALSFTRVFDMLIVVALMVLSCVIFLNYFNHKEMTRKVENLVRAHAISHVKSRKRAVPSKTKRRVKKSK